MAPTMNGPASAARTMFAVMFFIAIGAASVNAQALWAVTDWTSGAHATFYGGQDASGTMGGACGYGNLYTTGYGTETAALSNPLFNNGLSCGACFALQCVVSQSNGWCYPGGKTITVTATNACPPGSEGGWCDGKPHFDLAYPMFTQMAKAVGGVVPVLYKRVACSKTGGVRFTINGNPYFDNIMISNIANNGNIAAVYIQGGNSGWNAMSQNWGAYWQSGANLQGQTLSFKIVSGSETKIFYNVADSNWGFGKTYEADGNM